jgi:membrane protein implicated in regulation of membrane protease activity
MSEAGGLVGSARRVVAHGAALLRLERELAKAELERKTGVLGAGAFLSVAAGILALFALGFGLATLAAALALVVDWWLALLIVFALLVVIVVVLALVARSLFRSATPLKPVQALEEAQRTKEVLRGVGGDRA